MRIHCHIPLLERFEMQYIPEPNSGCWLWIGACNHDGYGQLKRVGGSNMAHRFSWEFHNGPIPDGMNVLHKCDTPPCVNPRHLFLGSQLVNMQDCARKKRTKPQRRLGSANPQARLTGEQVRLIRQMACSGTEIGREFGISARHANAIRQGKFWSHLC